MGFSASEMGRLASEGAYKLAENKMGDMEKWMGVIRHALGSLGMYLAMMGYVDDAQWQLIVGAVLAVVPFIMSWRAKS
jgi:hypothetical protein